MTIAELLKRLTALPTSRRQSAVRIVAADDTVGTPIRHIARVWIAANGDIVLDERFAGDRRGELAARRYRPGCPECEASLAAEAENEAWM